MKKSELIKIIKEELARVLSERPNRDQVKVSANADAAFAEFDKIRSKPKREPQSSQQQTQTQSNEKVPAAKPAKTTVKRTITQGDVPKNLKYEFAQEGEKWVATATDPATGKSARGSASGQQAGARSRAKTAWLKKHGK